MKNGQNVTSNAGDLPNVNDLGELSIPEAAPHRHINWPIVHSQDDLADKAKLYQAGKAMYPLQGKQIGEILIHYGIIEEKNLFIVRSIQKRPQYKNLPFGEILARIGILNPQSDDLPRSLLIQSGILMVDILTIDIPEKTKELIDLSHIRDKHAVPIGVYYNHLFLAVADPFTFTDGAFFSMLTGLKVVPVFAPLHDITRYLYLNNPQHKMAENTKEQFFSLAQIDDNIEDQLGQAVANENNSDISESDSIIVNLVNQMILHAIQVSASDIHVELFHDGAEATIRLRRDGRMEHFAHFPRIYYKAVVSRIKVIARLDISDRRRPQDGKISFNTHNRERVELRVATIPTMLGVELVTIRVLTSGEPLPLNELGLSARDVKAFRDVLQQPYGLILVCGPTGSGKTTSLHSALKELNTEDRKIWTAEDPVEIVQPRLCQVQINAKAGLTFESALRAFLRADPDIIMVGETRDKETAKMVVESSMTGHLVFSTLHTNSAPETVARLLGLEIDPYNLADALLMVLSQRLARKLCKNCLERKTATTVELEHLATEYLQSGYGRLPTEQQRSKLIDNWISNYGKDGIIQLGHPVGCAKCSEGGYKGRIGLYELLVANHELRQAIRQNANSGVYKEIAINNGMRTLKQDGIEKVLMGLTDMMQVYGACN